MPNRFELPLGDSVAGVVVVGSGLVCESGMGDTLSWGRDWSSGSLMSLGSFFSGACSTGACDLDVYDSNLSLCFLSSNWFLSSTGFNPSQFTHVVVLGTAEFTHEVRDCQVSKGSGLLIGRSEELGEARTSPFRYQKASLGREYSNNFDGSRGYRRYRRVCCQRGWFCQGFASSHAPSWAQVLLSGACGTLS